MRILNFLNMPWKMAVPPTPDFRFPTFLPRDSHCYIFLQILTIQPFNMHIPIHCMHHPICVLKGSAFLNVWVHGSYLKVWGKIRRHRKKME